MNLKYINNQYLTKKIDYIIYFSLLFYQYLILSNYQLYFSYNYDGSLSFVKIILSLIAIKIISELSKYLDTYYKNNFFTLYKYFLIVPTLSIFSLTRSEYVYDYLGVTLIPYFSILFITRILIYYKIIIQKIFNGIIYENEVLNYLLYISVLLTFMIGYYNLNIGNYDIYNVYNTRKIQSTNLPIFLQYSTTILITSILPITSILSLRLRLYYKYFISLIAFGLLFIFTSNRICLVIPLMVIMYYLFSSNVYIYQLKTVICGSLISLLILAVINYKLVWEITDIIFRRLLLDPSFTNLIYIEFFKNHPLYGFENNIISFINLKNYEIPFTNLIGTIQTANNSSNASVGIVGSSFARFGDYGNIFYSIPIFFIFLFFKTINLKRQRTEDFTFIPYFTLITGTDITTIFLTHGFIFVMLVSLIIKNDD